MNKQIEIQFNQEEFYVLKDKIFELQRRMMRQYQIDLKASRIE